MYSFVEVTWSFLGRWKKKRVAKRAILWDYSNIFFCVVQVIVIYLTATA